ncbi:MAG: hypothetical protein CM1200mP34_2360 [Verrucomicrobiales bacterium]|nr:MAG: hypothetical protein CM1200mP34_2360 [Verrucomicrobiales bacterium]
MLLSQPRDLGLALSGVEPRLFEEKVRDMFLNIAKEWGVPLEILNDGEVRALGPGPHGAWKKTACSASPWAPARAAATSTWTATYHLAE